MARVFQSDESTNLPQDFFKFKNVPEMKKRTIESVISGKELVWSKNTQNFGDIPMFSNKKESTYSKSALLGIIENTPFSDLFFSKENIENLQNLLRYTVYIKSNKKHVISKQNETELVIVMRAIFLQNSNNPTNPKDFENSINILNNLVVKEILPNLISNIEQYYGYLAVISSDNRRIVRLPTNTSTAGNKTILGGTADALFGNSFFDQ